MLPVVIFQEAMDFWAQAVNLRGLDDNEYAHFPMLSARDPWYVVRPRNLYRRWWHRPCVLLLFSWCLAMAVLADEKAKTIADVAGPLEQNRESVCWNEYPCNENGTGRLPET